MTTIAWDGIYLAADSQSTRDFPGTGHCEHCNESLSKTVNSVRKILVPSEKDNVFFREQKLIAVGGAGDSGFVGLYRMGIINNVPLGTIYTMAHELHKNKANTPTAVLLVVTDVAVWEVRHTKFQARAEEITQVPYAIGTGDAAAMLAMKRLGLTAMAAVGCAIDVDPFSGGEVSYVSCRDEVSSKVQKYKWTPEDIDEFFQ